MPNSTVLPGVYVYVYVCVYVYVYVYGIKTVLCLLSSRHLVVIHA